MLTLFVDWHSGGTRPAPDGDVAIECPAVAGFFMGVERGDAMYDVDVVQYRYGLADADDQPRAAGAQAAIEIGEGVAQEGIVPAAGIRLRPKRGLDDVERQHRPAAGQRGDQWRMVVDPKVALEPDNLHAPAHNPPGLIRRRAACRRDAK